jgi:hypothetical protein
MIEAQMQDRVVIHVGLPKCGSTFIQNELLFGRADFKLYGKVPSSYVRNDFESKVFVELEGLAKKRGWLSSGCLAALAALVKSEEVKEHLKVVISSENLCHPYYLDTKTVSERLLGELGAFKVILILREQLSWMESLYLHQARQSPSIGLPRLDEWLLAAGRNGGARALNFCKSYDDIVATWIDVCGIENVTVMLFEEFFRNPVKTGQVLGRLIGISDNEIEKILKERRPVKERLNKTAYFLSRLRNEINMNRLFNRMMRHSAIWILNGFDSLIPESSVKPAINIRKYLSKEDLEDIKEANKVVSDLMGMRLDNFGYI